MDEIMKDDKKKTFKLEAFVKTQRAILAREIKRVHSELAGGKND